MPLTRLLAVGAIPNRAQQVDRLIEALRATDGPAIVPLCFALERRSLLAAQNPRAASALVRHLSPQSGATAQDAAARTLTRLMAVDYLRRTDLRITAATAAAALLDGDAVPAPVRSQLVGTLGESGLDTVERMPAALAHLQLVPAAETNMEQTTRVAMIGFLHLASQRQAVGDAFLQVPLDDGDSTFARAFARIDPERAAHEIPKRIKRILTAQAADVSSLIEAVEELPPNLAADALLQIFPLSLDANEKLGWAGVCAAVCKKQPEERFIQPLGELLAQGGSQLTWLASDALMSIGTAQAAEVLRPHLREEMFLSQKLRIAEFLGRHGIRDGYPYAIEHLSENGLTDPAIAVLVAIQDPDAIPRLRTILTSSNDVAWRSAAVRALGALKITEDATEFLAWASDLTNPLAPASLIALADLGDLRVTAKVREGLGSRNDQVVTASATAAGKLLASGNPATADLGDLLAALLADPQADDGPRTAALEALLSAKDPRVDRAMAAADLDAKLQGSSLLTRVETLLSERKIAVLP